LTSSATIVDDHFSSRRSFIFSGAAAATTLPAALSAAPPAAAAAAAPAAPPLCAPLSDASAARNPGVGWALRKRDKQLLYPPWLEGAWRVRARFEGAAFPLGNRFISKTVPGALKASMAVTLPDVGAAMDRELTFDQRFAASPEQGGVVADR
jgi:hypothetical protein